MTRSRDPTGSGGPGAEPLSSTRVLAGKYRLGRALGEGGMGAVYEAEHLELGSRVAVKLLSETGVTDQKTLARFRREARAMGAIRHENVVAVMDTGTDDGAPYLVMELLEGESLAAMLRRERVLTPELACWIAGQVLAGVGAAHAVGVIHRDLKPGNVFLTRSRDGSHRAKILDFGISKLRDASATLNVTAEGALVGTPNFMAPEQFRPRIPIDRRADLYAVGVMLYRMVCGRLPFVGESSDELYRRILDGRPPAPRELRAEIPPEIESVIFKAMHREREERYADASEFAEALRPLSPFIPHVAPSLEDPRPERDSHPSPTEELPESSAPAIEDRSDPRAGDASAADAESGSDARAPASESAPAQERAYQDSASAGFGRPAQGVGPAPSISGDGAELPTEDSVQSAGRATPGGQAPTAAGPREIDAPPPTVAGHARAKRGAESSAIRNRARLSLVLTAVIAIGGAVGAGATYGALNLLSANDGEVATRGAAAEAVEGDPLHFGITRHKSPEEIRSELRPIREHLAARLDRPVELRILDNYRDVADELLRGDIDLGALSAYSYVRAERKDDSLRLLATPVTDAGTSYEGYILARVDEGIDELNDFAGKVFCYVSKNSSSGYLYPRALFRRAGMDPDGAFKATRFTTDHEASLQALADGACDGAAVYDSAWERAGERGIDRSRLKVVETTDRIPWDAYAVTDQLDASTADALDEALAELEVGGRAAEEVLTESEAPFIGFKSGDDALYDPVRSIRAYLDEEDEEPDSPEE